MKKPTILITNDDGIEAPGLFHLWQALQGFADTYVVAPSKQQSGVSVSLTLHSPLHMEELIWKNQFRAWKVNGTPADCVKMALRTLLPNPPNLIVSGINSGINPGKSVFHSGTVGAIIEGILQDIPGIAFSIQDMPAPHFHLSEKHVSAVVKHVLDVPLPLGTFLNVNFPNLEQGLRGFKFAAQGKSRWREKPQEHIDQDGKKSYFLNVTWTEQEEHQESDVHWLRQGYMTAVPICIEELTHQKLVEDRRHSFEQLFTI